MYRILSLKFVLFALLICGSAGMLSAQGNLQPVGDRPPPDERGEVKRPNLLKILGLSPAQMLDVRRVNQARKPQMDAAQGRLRDANRALDEAIYADNFDQAAFDTRLKEVQAAQADVARLRFTNEMNIRKILTPEQLARFRELRRQFAPPPQDQRVPRGVDDKNTIPRRIRVP
jgi:Spy/CpxP family protein refolding chaperone